MYKVSVIVPVYNVEKYLERCVSSILYQSFRHFELILVDDGSTDSSGHICDEYCKKDNRIVVIHKCNGGLSSARNKGLDIARGDYITFIDSDDYVDEAYIERLYNMVTKSGADISMCSANTESNISIPIKDELFESKDVFTKRLEDNSFIFTVAWGKLFKKECLNNIKFKDGFVHEDEFFSNELYINNYKIISTKDKLYNYIYNPCGIMSSVNRKELLNRFDSVYERCLIVRKNLRNIYNRYQDLLYYTISELLIINNKKHFYEKVIIKEKATKALKCFAWNFLGIKYKFRLLWKMCNIDNYL